MNRYISLLYCLLLFLCQPITMSAIKNWEYTHLDNNQGMSNSSVNTIYQDKEGMIWIGTWDGLNRYDGSKFIQYHAKTNDTTTLSHPVIRHILEEDEQYLWIVTDWGLNRFNRKSGQSRRFFLNNIQQLHFVENSFRCTVNRQGDVVANVSNGDLYRFDKAQERFIPLKADKKPVGKIIKIGFNSNNQLWIITSQYIHCYLLAGTTIRQQARFAWPGQSDRLVMDNKGDIWGQRGEDILYLNTQSWLFNKVWKTTSKLLSVEHHAHEYIYGTDNGYYLHTTQGDSHFLPNTTITSLFRGTQDVLWVGTDGRGLYQYYTKTKYIHSYTIGTKNLPVRCMLQQDNETLIGIKGEGLLVYQQGVNGELQLKQSIHVGSGRSDNAVFSLVQGVDADRRVWVGTDGVGLAYYHQGKLHKMQFRQIADQRKVFSVYAITPINDSTLYLGTSGNGLLRITYRNNIIHQVYVYNAHKATSLQSDIVYAQVYRKPFLWLGTRGGGLIRLDTRNQHIQSYRADGNNDNGIVSNDVISLYQDKKNRLWIGTTQGLDMMQGKGSQARFVHVGTENTLRNLNIHNIQEDIFGHIWVSTSNGIARIKPDFSITHFSHKDGLQGDEFSDGAGMTTDGDKKIYFGGTKGLSIIHPQLIQSDGWLPKLLLNHFKVDHQPTPLSQPYRVSDGAKSIELGFSILDYINNDRCELSYKLVKNGLFSVDDNSPWVNVGERKTILLNELPPGSYTLYVRQSNATHQWASDYLAIPFSIAYPLWARWWAILLYTVVAIVVIRIIYTTKKKRLQRHHRHEIERQRQENREKTHHAKIRFFANVTSKFSNNITQIYDALEMLRQRKGNDQELSAGLARIDEHVKQMNYQIKQMSEIRSAEDNRQNIAVERANLNDLLRIALDNFSSDMVNKDINLKMVQMEENDEIITDKAVFSKIVQNIMAYILPNIHSQSYLEVSHTISEIQVKVFISYKGLSPQPKEMEDIFNSFKALEKFENNMSAGKDDLTIPLTLANDLAKRMGGSVWIEKDETEQVTFCIAVQQMEETQGKKILEKKTKTAFEQILNSKDKNILLVEQDAKMAEFIHHILESQYNITIINNEEELKNEVTHIIDLVIYDMGGNNNTFIDSIRTNSHTHYAPIIALCNEGEKDSNVSIILTGANAILEKPFHTSYLKALVDRNIQEAARLKDFSYSSSAYIRRFDSQEMNEETRNFLLSAMRVTSDNYSDENYNPTRFAQDLTISRSQLYRKMKAALNMSPQDFILEYRMRHAERMLKTTSKTISEVISECGFRNRAFFYREFSKRYNCLPKEFRKDGEKEEGED